MKTETENYESYNRQEGCLALVIAIGAISTGILLVGTIYIIFF